MAPKKAGKRDRDEVDSDDSVPSESKVDGTEAKKPRKADKVCFAFLYLFILFYMNPICPSSLSPSPVEVKGIPYHVPP